MSRKSSLKSMSSLIGNAAAHRALEPESAFALNEAWLYETQAEEESEMRSWNETEITLFRGRSQNYAKNEIRKRTRSWRDRTEQTLIIEAYHLIDEFINEVLIQKKSINRKAIRNKN